MESSLGFGNLFWQAVWFGHPVYRKSKCWKRTDGFAQWDGMGMAVFMEPTDEESW
jgi:hypothetical protein